MATLKYLTLDEIKAYLNLDPLDTSEDNVLLQLGAYVEEIVEDFTGMSWDTVTEETYYFETQDGKTINLYPFAFWTITQVVSNGEVIDLNELEFQPYNKPYHFIEVKSDSSIFLENPIEVTGTVGFGPLPEKVKTLMLQLIQHFYRTKDFMNQAAVLPDGTRIFRDANIPRDIANALELIATRV